MRPGLSHLILYGIAVRTPDGSVGTYSSRFANVLPQGYTIKRISIACWKPLLFVDTAGSSTRCIGYSTWCSARTSVASRWAKRPRIWRSCRKSPATLLQQDRASKQSMKQKRFRSARDPNDFIKIVRIEPRPGRATLRNRKRTPVLWHMEL